MNSSSPESSSSSSAALLLHESIAVMVEQEEKFYRCHSYHSSLRLHTSPMSCSCDFSQRALSLLNECAILVTDPSCHRHHPVVGNDHHHQRRRLLLDANGVSPVVDESPKTVVRTGHDDDDDVVDHHHHFHEQQHPTTKPSKSRLGEIANLCFLCQKPVQGLPLDTEQTIRIWREHMFDWASMVIEFCGVHDEAGVIGLAFKLLDRVLAEEITSTTTTTTEVVPATTTRERYQLISMTTLFSAIKFMEGDKRLKIQDLVAMSCGLYQACDFVAMERHIFETLQWRLNAPTTISFCRLFLDILLLEEDDDKGQKEPEADDTRALLEECCSALAEIVVVDPFFDSSARDSMTALASVVLAARLHFVPDSTIAIFFEKTSTMIRGNNDEEFHTIYRHLERVFCVED